MAIFHLEAFSGIFFLFLNYKLYCDDEFDFAIFELIWLD